MASDRLFEILAQAKAQPDRWARAVNAGADAGNNILGGYVQGKDIGQQLQKYKLLNTPLGQIFPDPSTIPGGLSPNHTVSDLMNLAPVLPYIPTESGGQIATMMMGGTPQPGGSSPLGGANVKQPTPGSTDLDSIEGAGAGNQGNVPQGTPTAITGGVSAPSPASTATIPRMSLADVQRYGPLMNDIRQGRQFQQQQGAEESRFERGQGAEESRFQRGKMASVAEEASKNLANTGSIQDDINNLRGLYQGYHPLPFVGGLGASIAGASGQPNFGTQTMQQGQKIDQVAPGLGAKVNYELTHRFSPGESQLLMQKVTPTSRDDESVANMKLDNMQRLTTVFKNGDQNTINMVASAIAGRPVQAQIPTSTPTQSPSNVSSGDPEADAAIQRVQASGLNPQAKQARINAIRARMRPNG